MEFDVSPSWYHTRENECETTDLYELVELMEASEFDGETLGEQYANENGFVEPITGLAAIAARTEPLDIGQLCSKYYFFDNPRDTPLETTERFEEETLSECSEL